MISGGQSGADIGGVVGAFSAGHSCLFIAFRGFKPQGRDSLPSVIPYKDAVMPEWAVSYPQMLLARTQHNVELADATVVFINTMHLKDSIGSRRTMEYAQKMQRPRLLLTLFGQSDVEPTASVLSEWVQRVKPEILNIAGSRTCDEDLVSRITEKGLKQCLTV